MLALASLLATTVRFVSAIAVLDSNGIGGASPWASVLLSVSLMGFAALSYVHPGAAGKSRQWPTAIAVDVTNYPNRTKRS